MVAFPWGAYGVSQAAYYHKSTKENTVGGITYETAVNNLCYETCEEEEDV
jgi:hypothetical protein